MSDAKSELHEAPLTQAEIHAGLFAQMVMQFSSTALVLMGRAPNPMTGKTETDLESARLFIDQLEMIEAKTRGNLTAEEQHLLKQSLMTVRMAFVEAVKETKSKPAAASADKAAPQAVEHPTAEKEAEPKKKFSKSYGAE